MFQKHIRGSAKFLDRPVRIPFFAILIAALLLAVTAVHGQSPAAKLRTITVATSPKAAVWIDGVKYGVTNDSGELTIRTVLPGRKRIVVRLDGHKQAQLDLLPTRSGTVEIPVTPTTDEAELAFQEGERLSTVDRPKAIAAYEKAAKLRPKFAEAYIGAARMYADSAKFDKAHAAVAQARKASPGNAEASVVDGRAYKAAGDNEKAIVAYKRSIKEGRGFQPEAFAGLGLLYKEQAEQFAADGDREAEAKNYQLAAENLAASIKQLSGAPDAVVMYQFLGLIYEERKETAKAIAVYEEFIELYPDNPEAETFRSFIVQLKKPTILN